MNVGTKTKQARSVKNPPEVTIEKVRKKNETY
jgi:hypothetical protein